MKWNMIANIITTKLQKTDQLPKGELFKTNFRIHVKYMLSCRWQISKRKIKSRWRSWKSINANCPSRANLNHQTAALLWRHVQGVFIGLDIKISLFKLQENTVLQRLIECIKWKSSSQRDIYNKEAELKLESFQNAQKVQFSMTFTSGKTMR